ncbi:hypothetical protein DDU77_20475 [Salmonella enterica]|nr:hypothetical protein [Salmonella enterica]
MHRCRQMKGNCADLHLGGVVKLPGLTASSWATCPPPPCKAGFLRCQRPYRHDGTGENRQDQDERS